VCARVVGDMHLPRLTGWPIRFLRGGGARSSNFSSVSTRFWVSSSKSCRLPPRTHSCPGHNRRGPRVDLPEHPGPVVVGPSVAVPDAGGGAAGGPHMDGDVQHDELRVSRGGKLAFVELPRGGQRVAVQRSARGCRAVLRGASGGDVFAPKKNAVGFRTSARRLLIVSASSSRALTAAASKSCWCPSVGI